MKFARQLDSKARWRTFVCRANIIMRSPNCISNKARSWSRRIAAIGIVTAIAAPAAWRLWIDGQGGHAGAVLMHTRHDAFLAAAEIALAVESAAKTTGAEDTVGTTGVCDIFPSAINSIPSRVRLDIDFRDIDLVRRDRALHHVGHAIAEVSVRRGVTVRKEVLNADPPAQCDPLVIGALTRACEKAWHRSSVA